MPNEPQLIRLRVDREISQETWLAFIHRWKAFKIGWNISSQNASIQLFQCAHDKLGDLNLANDSRLTDKSEEYVAHLMESIATIKVAVSVIRAEMVSFYQGHDELFRTFATPVQSMAETSNFTTVSECEN